MSSTCGNCSCADKSQCVGNSNEEFLSPPLFGHASVLQLEIDLGCFCGEERKKGNSYGVEIIETEKKSYDNNVVEVPAAENGGECKCGSSCACVNCTCGH